MSVKTVRLDETTEAALNRLSKETGLTGSELLRQGVAALAEQRQKASGPTAWEVYEAMDLGPGGYATAPSTEVNRGVREALRRKHGR